METTVKKSTIIGACLGFVFSGLIALLMICCTDKFEFLQRFCMFFGSAPAYLAALINPSDLFVTTVYLIYWILLGGVFGFLWGLKNPVAQKVATALVIVLAVLHYVAMVQLSKAIEDAVRALADALSGKL